MIDTALINSITNYFIEVKGFFTFQEFSEEVYIATGNCEITIDEFMGSLTNNNELIVVRDEGKKDVIVISKRNLFLFFAYLNIRLSKIGISKLTEKQLINRISWVFPLTKFDKIPEIIVGFARDFGLFSRISDTYYVFPLANFISNIFSNMEHKKVTDNKKIPINTNLKYKIAKNAFDNIAYEKALVIPRIDLYNNCLQYILRKIKNKRQLYILMHRTGINNCQFLTLDKLAEYFGVTRERIRQIESKTFNKILHNINEMIYYLILYILYEKCRLIYNTQLEDYVTMTFFMTILGINYSELSDLSLSIISLNDITKINELIDNMYIASEHSKIIKELVNIDNNSLRYEDIIYLADKIYTYAIDNANVSERILLSMKKIGKPAHYSENNRSL